MNFDKYKNTRPFNLPKDLALPGKIRAALEHALSEAQKDLIMTEYKDEVRREMRRAFRAEEARLGDLFKKDALEEVGLTDHPKADKAFNMAYDRGHSSGYREVMGELEELANLLL